MDELKELYDQVDRFGKELTEMKVLMETEKRSPSDEEKKRAAELVEKIFSIHKEIDERALMSNVDGALKMLTEPKRAVVKPDVGKNIGSGEKKGFRSLGEFLQAVYAASQPEGRLDPRLVRENRAISGMSESVPADGGFLVQTDFSTELLKRVYDTGVILPRARRIPISGTANSMKINAVAETSRASGSRWGGVLGYWLQEAGTKTASAPKFRQMELTLKKLIGLCYATDELLADAATLESVVMQAFAEEFGFMLDDALINGTGVGQPLGVMNSACLVTVTRNTAASVLSQDIVGMWARGWSRSRPNFVWFINQDVEPQLLQLSLTVGTAGGQLTYMPPGGLSERPYATLLGRPVIAIEQAQTLGTKGDIMLADFGQYLLAEKGGMQSASSIHVRFVNDETAFRFVLRIDGQPIWNAALTPYKGSNTQSPFVVLS